jgi:AraC-like DNA-binding protein
MITSLVMITVFLTNNRYPMIFSLMKKELLSRKYERSFLKGLDTGKIRSRLKGLMEDEKLYRDSELSLRSLSAIMLLSPHQLSQFLNEQMGLNFNNFVNRYRVEEALELLVSSPEQTVLAIGLYVGFNSKSSFNTVFKKFTGCTPSEYRDNNFTKNHNA